MCMSVQARVTGCQCAARQPWWSWWRGVSSVLIDVMNWGTATCTCSCVVNWWILLVVEVSIIWNSGVQFIFFMCFGGMFFYLVYEWLSLGNWGCHMSSLESWGCKCHCYQDWGCARNSFYQVSSDLRRCDLRHYSSLTGSKMALRSCNTEDI